MNLFFYKIGLLVVFPFFLMLHGVYWVTNKESFALAVYALKLAFLPFLFVAFVRFFPGLIKGGLFVRISLIVAPCFALSMATPFIFGGNSTFYYLSDMTGLMVTISSVPIIYLLLTKSILTFRFIEKTYAYYLFIVSFYIVLYYFFSGGDKISITPEMHMPMAIVIGAFLVPMPDSYRPSIWLIALIAFACALSQLRENLLLYVLIGATCLIRSLIFSSPRKLVLIFIAAQILIVLFGSYFAKDLVLERLGSMRLNSSSSSVMDGSISQRFVEIELMKQEMKKIPASFVVGKGFGATYENIENVLIYYGDRVHNAHSTPFVVYFRHGIYGLIIFLIPIVLAACSLIKEDVFCFRASLVVVSIYCALLFNQYLFWNVQYGVAVALLLYSLKIRKIRRS